ncbi:hypothetical protein RDV78_01970 [Bacillota bacterium LX-D]|nr:hypothetical protein [Bacillota bacterium LX-D]
MSLLGNVGSLYMIILILLLIIGLGLITIGLFNYIITFMDKSLNLTKLKIGGMYMQNNNWLRLALFSFVGIIISVVVLSFVTSGSNSRGYSLMQQTTPMNGMNMGNMYMQSIPNWQTGMNNGMNTMMPMYGTGMMNMGMPTNQGMMMNGIPMYNMGGTGMMNMTMPTNQSMMMNGMPMNSMGGMGTMNMGMPMGPMNMSTPSSSGSSSGGSMSGMGMM